jgi:hypothetical protein
MSVDRARWERWSEEDAFSFCVEFLTEYTNGRLRRDRTEFDISATEVESQLCLKHQITEHNYKLDLGSLTGAKILSALWQLCLKGVLRPSVRALAWTQVQEAIAGNGYSLTEAGKEWIKNPEKTIMVMASGSYATLLSNFSEKFGNAYKERVIDAVKCFDAGAFFACAAMCGAASEAIYLALAIAKEGPRQEEAVLKKYRASDGRKQLQNTLTHGLAAGLRQSLESGFTILAYWRDASAHGESSDVGAAEARTALQTLFSLAQLASDRWADLTSPKQQPQQPTAVALPSSAENRPK